MLFVFHLKEKEKKVLTVVYENNVFLPRWKTFTSMVSWDCNKHTSFLWLPWTGTQFFTTRPSWHFSLFVYNIYHYVRLRFSGAGSDETLVLSCLSLIWPFANRIFFCLNIFICVKNVCIYHNVLRRSKITFFTPYNFQITLYRVQNDTFCH